MSLQAFERGAGFSALAFNHLTLLSVGTTTLLCAAIVVLLLIQHFEVNSNNSHYTIVIYVVLVLLALQLLFTALHNIWG